MQAGEGKLPREAGQNGALGLGKAGPPLVLSPLPPVLCSPLGAPVGGKGAFVTCFSKIFPEKGDFLLQREHPNTV